MAQTMHLVVNNDDGSSITIDGNVTFAQHAAPITTPPVVTPPIVTPPPANAPFSLDGAHIVDLLASNKWTGNHDSGTPGDANGSTTYPVKSSDGRICRSLDFETINGGGYIYHGRVLDDWSPYNAVVYKVRERIVLTGAQDKGWLDILQCETDIELVDPKTGIPYDMATQQSKSGGLEISKSHKWTPTGIVIDPTKRDNNAWHETWVYLKINPANGAITWFGVMQDGQYYPINQTANDNDSSTWTKGIANFQLQFNGAPNVTTKHKILLDMYQFAFLKV